ncbi:MAG: glycosyltransferase [candidate division Zixibacteria bacterium]|nr:glycosyltransferase [candidate division Zixibacteria bacterium]
MKKISVLHIVLSTVTGGMENVIYNLASNYDPSKLKLTIGCLVEVGFLSEKLREKGIESYLVPRMTPGVSMLYPRPLIKFIKDSGCDIVHTHSGCWMKVAAACAYLPRVKLIYTEHGRAFPDKASRIFLDRLSINFTDKVVAVGDTLKDYMINTVKLPPRKVMTIFNGIDTGRFQPSMENRSSVREEFGYTDENVVIGIVARLAEVKNHSFLIKTLKEIIAQCPEIRLLVIGDGPLRNELEQLTDGLGLPQFVTFAGDRNDVPRLLCGVDISTLCSVSEGISLTILEAMASSLPVVATNVGGNSTIIKNGENGFLTEVGNIGDYGAKLTSLIKSPGMRAEIGNKARNHVIDNWGVKGMADAYQKLYEELLGQN